MTWLYVLVTYFPFQESKQTRIVVPGKVGVLKASPDSNYCIATISERIHVWQVGVTVHTCTSILYGHHWDHVAVLLLLSHIFINYLDTQLLTFDHTVMYIYMQAC